MKKTALITGASRGIGKAISEKLASQGYNLVLICKNNMDILQELKASFEKEYDIICMAYQGDVSKHEFIENVFFNISSLDVLINNAGISYVGLLQDMSITDWHNVIDTNLSSIFYTCRLATPLMLKNHSGHIINISSMWGNVGASMEVAYSASKGGVNTFTKALAKELAPSGISVNALSCGIIDTDMNNCFSLEELSSFTEEIPMGRMGTASEVADMIFNIIKAPTYMTGQIIGLDGGYI